MAKPDKQVVVLHGDGSFGLNAMEFDTLVRHDLPIMVVISLKRRLRRQIRIKRSRAGTWATPGSTRWPRRSAGHGEFVENPDDIRDERSSAPRPLAVAKGTPALVNVKTDWTARATTTAFSNYST